MKLHYTRILVLFGVTFIASIGVSSAEDRLFPITPIVPVMLEEPVSIAEDYESLQQMAVSMISLQQYKGIYRVSGYEDILEAQIFMPDLFVALPDGNVVTKSKIRAYYGALFNSWLEDARANRLLRQLRLSKRDWEAYGSSTIQNGEQGGAGNRLPAK